MESENLQISICDTNCFNKFTKHIHNISDSGSEGDGGHEY